MSRRWLSAILSGMLGFGAFAGHEWKCNDGGAAKTVKSSVASKFNGQIRYPRKFRWETSPPRGNFIRLDGASVEIWTADYQGERYVSFGKRFFRVIRTFQSGFDYTTLILQEVVR